MSEIAVGAGATTGVSVLVAVWPVISVTRYVMVVCAPATALLSATKVTTPVTGFKVYVPSPVIEITLSASQVVVVGT